MKKSLIAGASVFALVAGYGASALADDVNVAVSLGTLNQTVVNSATVTEENDEANQGIAGGAQDSLNNDFGSDTFEDQVLNQNNINSGINSGQQGGNAAAIAVDQDGVLDLGLDPEFDANVAISGNIADQDVTNTASVDSTDGPVPDNADPELEEDGIAGEALRSLNNDFGSDTFDNQAINQNNINSGINSAQQGANAAALAVDFDGSEDEVSVNAAFSGNYLTQEVSNEALVTDGDPGDNGNEDNDAIAGEAVDSLRNTFGTQTFENQVINQNNINSGINSAQQGANTASIAASIGDPDIDLGPGDPDSETDDAISDAIGAIEDALAFDVGGAGLGNMGGDVEAFEANIAASRSQGEQTVVNNADNSGDSEANEDGDEDGGIGGDPVNSLHNNFGDDTFRKQAINQNNINSGINSAQQGANTTSIATDTDGAFNILDLNIAVSDSNQTQTVTNTAAADDEDNDGVGGFDPDNTDPDEPNNSLFNSFGSDTYREQVINQNNINAGINSMQQGMNTTAMAIDNSGSFADGNAAWASTTGVQNGSNSATDDSDGVLDDTGLGIGGNPKQNNLNNVFGSDTFREQGINQNNVNAGINSAQQGGNTSALAVADNVSFVDVNLSAATTDLTQGSEETPLSNLASTTGDNSSGIGGNPQGLGDGIDPLSNEFGSDTFREQVMNQNNINSGINSAQQGANTTALSLDLGGPGGVDLNGAVSLASLSQTVTNTAVAGGMGNAGIAGGPNNALNNNFGNHTFQDQVINQNNINSGINSVQQGSNTVAIAVSGGTGF
ncbi:hypothetical protein [Pelagibius sp.]|uniref:beta strand repeat-containing protein n=1 Tax=Pelagibius sp. TaxID=1931238 RepID=UPI00260A13F5|nr:hypothetical protein [Pelagibius sp.]